jgi:hypothetical protein
MRLIAPTFAFLVPAAVGSFLSSRASLPLPVLPPPAVTPPAVTPPCETIALLDPDDVQSVICIDSCGVHGCKKFTQSTQYYGSGETCGCPGGGPWVCCHLVAGIDPAGKPWTIATGSCAKEDDCGNDGICKRDQVQEAGVTEFSASCH